MLDVCNLGFGSGSSPLPTANLTWQAVITDGYSDYFMIAPPNNWNGHSGQIVPFTQEPMEDSQSPDYDVSFCGGDSGGDLIGFTASFSTQYHILYPGRYLLLLNCAVGGAGYGSNDAAGDTGLEPNAYWGAGNPMSERCISASQNMFSLWPNASLKGIIAAGPAETDAQNSMPGSTWQTYSINQAAELRSAIPTATSSTPIVYLSMVPGWTATAVGTAQDIQSTMSNLPNVISYSAYVLGADMAAGDCGLIHYSGPAQVVNGINIANAFAVLLVF